MTKAEQPEAETRRHSGDAPRTRFCLRCGSSFMSEWSGERICKSCKGTSSWRNGLPHSGKPSRER